MASNPGYASQPAPKAFGVVSRLLGCRQSQAAAWLLSSLLQGYDQAGPPSLGSYGGTSSFETLGAAQD